MERTSTEYVRRDRVNNTTWDGYACLKSRRFRHHLFGLGINNDGPVTPMFFFFVSWIDLFPTESLQQNLHTRYAVTPLMYEQYSTYIQILAMQLE